MSKIGWERFNAAIDKTGFYRIGYVQTKFGTVYLAEKSGGPAGWTIMWAARDMVQKLECVPGSSQQQRRQAAINEAFRELQSRNSVFKEV